MPGFESVSLLCKGVLKFQKEPEHATSQESGFDPCYVMQKLAHAFIKLSFATLVCRNRHCRVMYIHDKCKPAATKPMRIHTM